MNQRGFFVRMPQFNHARSATRWTRIGSILTLTCLLLLTFSFVLFAQDAAPIPECHVTIRVDGTERTVTTQKPIVQFVLHQEGISLGDHDRITPDITTPVTDGMMVTITRVTCVTTKERIAVPPPTTVRWHRRMTTTPVVISPGRPGVAERTRVVWKKDGVVSEQWTQNSHIVVKPKPKVVMRGPLPSRGGRDITVVATAYDPGPGSCGPFATGHTAIGMHAGRGIVAVDPRVIPLGSRVYIPGYGPAIAADTGGAIKGNRIDVCFPTRGEALRWGRRTVRVTVLE